MIRDFGLQEYKWLSHNLHKAIAGLEELKEKDVVLDYRVEKTLDQENRNALIEAKFVIKPHPNFISEVMDANQRQKQVSQTPKPTDLTTVGLSTRNTR